MTQLAFTSEQLQGDGLRGLVNVCVEVSVIKFEEKKK